MSGEPQLERSVLEGKERDKLQAIADALGLKIPARAKKTDLIDGILRATGVEATPPAEAEAAKPKRAPRRRSVEAAGPNGAGDQGVLATLGDGPEPAGDPARDPLRAEPEAPAAAVSHGGGDDGPGTDDDREIVAPAAARPEVAEVAAGGSEAPPAAAEPRPQPVRQPPQPGGPPGPGNAIAGNHTSPGPGNQHQSGPPGQSPGEGGDVRRNRRRRGRDRDRAGYDQQAQQADQAYAGEPLPCDGVLDLRAEGFGFLRTSGYLTGPDDVYVSTSQVRKFALRPGDRVVGASRPATTQERFGALLRIDAVGDQSPEEARRRPRLDDLTVLHPDERLSLELADADDPAATTARIIDLLAPIGKGQRGLIVSPPRAGTTTVVKHIARAVEANHPDVDLMVVLVDERPEEVADIRRSVKAEVIGSGFDRPPEEHTHVAELAIEVAKRRVELGRDVVVLVDGLTRLTRAYNLSVPPVGRVMSGGVDPTALFPPKRLFGAARKVQEGGSLTIVATALVDTGSPDDTVIFDQLRGTANMELRLDRRLAERRIYPAVDVVASTTGHEEQLRAEDDLERVWELRRALAATAHDGSGAKAHEMLVAKLQQAGSNADLLAQL